MSAVLEVHGEVFRSDEHPYQTKPSNVGDELSPIMPQEISNAKRGWPRSAPGRDGVTVPAVARCSNNVLAALFNLILASNYHLIEWKEMRTILIPSSATPTPSSLG